ncbi:hypothetical protein [Roseibium sp.]|uniref:hypothetical protein n=1 Tax=Roseibium sp. TaxID=1936156 RepID=UPI003D0EC6EC
MSFKLNSIAKAASVILICGLLAACQSTGLKPGSLTSSFAPKGWVARQNGTKAIYFCSPSVCKSPEAVIVGPMKINGDVETAIRQGLLSKELMNALENVINVASKGEVRFTTERRIVTKTYSGFDLATRFKTDKGYVYGSMRLLIQNDRGSMVASFAKSRAKAKANLKRFLNRTTVRRLR